MKISSTHIFLALLLISLSMNACKKGDIGPQGLQGEQGETGEQGAPGPDGSVILSGTTAPTASLGKNGDYYLNKTTSALYGPKTSSGWGDPINLKGTAGATGSAGSTILSGTTAPAASLGRNGDYYINITSMGFYGPKTSDGWGTPVSLKGPKGDPGNANVYSKIFLPANITWRQTTLFGTNYVTASLSAAEITSDIVNNGAVMVYGGFFWGDPWSALPISYFESGRTVHFSYGVKQGSVTLRMHYSNNAAPTAPGIQFKIVIIKGLAVTSAKENGINLDDYTSVKRFFQLQD